MKFILETVVLFTKEAKEYRDKETGQMKKPEHKCLVIVEDNITDEEGNVKPSTQELKCFIDRAEVPKGKIKFEVRVSPWIPEGKKRAELSVKILKILK